MDTLRNKYGQPNQILHKLVCSKAFTTEYPMQFSKILILADVFNLTVRQVQKLSWLGYDELLFMSQFERRI